MRGPTPGVPKHVAWPIRFIANLDMVSRPGHWLWTGQVDDDGYGVLSVDGRPAKATHLALVLAGRWVGPQGQVNHHCDTPACCNPACLYVGTAKQNAEDRVARGRSHSMAGERHPSARLTWEKVRRIRALQHVASQREIAELFDAKQTTVSAILRGKSWKEEDDPNA